MQNIKDIILILAVFTVGWALGRITVDSLDVNRDGQANLTDLSVLAVGINERNSQ